MWWPFARKYPERTPESVDSHEYDYVVVGGGTAGCVLASRLSENSNTSVLLLERGPVNDTWISRVPIISSNILNPNTGASSWLCEPMKHCNGRQSLLFCGEVMGGGSRVNGMVYHHGTAADFDSWAEMGHPEWSYEKVLPFFVKSERTIGQPKSDYRGDSGPWTNKAFPKSAWLFKVSQVFRDIAEGMGFTSISDTSAPDAPPDCIATFDSTVNEKSQRVSTFDAFLPRETALSRENNLTICTKTIVSKIVFSQEENGKKPCAQQIIFKSVDPKNQKVFSVKVKKEVIVCSGAIGSPQVLMLSGVGPRKHLDEHGIKVVHDLPGVGSELTDHIGIPVAWETPVSESLTVVTASLILKGGLEFLKYLFFGHGPKPHINVDETTPAVPIVYNPQEHLADIEIMPLPTSAMDNLEEHKRLFSKIGVLSLLIILLQSKSRGSVRLASSNPHDRPKIDLGILSNPEDYKIARLAVRLALSLGASMKASGFSLLRNLTFDEEEKDDEGVDKFIRERIRRLLPSLPVVNV
ncbi:hypothetical protein G7Y89_g14673 [Cudoniella acicularis]|uniref:Glucose-methanol-choline oxidoreductase N-terminal domain-containing protein n=1 Tax=Cudoniella acicularis TaxID=354080 RepID=A0A8H4R0H0_9HELO|nr:hypothetical protein G7Y89_g14673 [Cudoniella acicularis]